MNIKWNVFNTTSLKIVTAYNNTEQQLNIESNKKK